MNVIKNVSSLITIALGLCFSAVSINPANSSEITNSNDDEVLVSQLRGHDTYDGGEQIQWEGYTLGRVVGKSGGMMSIKAEDGTVFQAVGYARPGSDVLVGQDENGDYYVVRSAHPEWITELESDYGWKRTTMSSTTLNERTAAIWSEIEASSSQTVTQSLDVETKNDLDEETEVTTTVRGLW